jgi:hypothetical protein
MWTRFMDMHSGGDSKEKWQYIYIEAPEEEARIIFYNRFGHNPDRVTCTCCGEDYSVSEETDLKQATAFERGCRHAFFSPDGTECEEDKAWKCGKGLKRNYSQKYIEEPNRRPYGTGYLTLHQYSKRPEVLIIYAKDINEAERHGKIPKQGYVWI